MKLNTKLLLSVLAITMANSITAMEEYPVAPPAHEDVVDPWEVFENKLNYQLNPGRYHEEARSAKSLIDEVRKTLAYPDSIVFPRVKFNILNIPDNDPELNAVNNDGTTILDYVIQQQAAANPHYSGQYDELIDLLIQKGAKVSSKAKLQ